MTATREEIKEWLLKALENPKITHVVIACDEFDYENYPIEIEDIEDFMSKRRNRPRPDMDGEAIEEIYDLSLPIEDQLDEYRAWHIEPPKPKVVAKNNMNDSKCKKFQNDVLIKRKE